LVTAKHIVTGFDGTESIEVNHSGVWRSVPARLIGISRNDVAVLASEALRFATDTALPEDDPRLGFGQDVYFLGFPLGKFGELGELNNGYPHPFVKRAIVSSISAGNSVIYLDGINNSGFSGGMVVAQDFTRDGLMRISGVISGYVGDPQQVQRFGRATKYTVIENTGLIEMQHIYLANQLIDQNPNGRLLGD
jgi:hypothetical protein